MFEKTALEIIAAITGIVGMPIIGWLKGLLKIDDFKAVLLATASSFVLGFVAVYLKGDFSFAEVTPETVAAAFGLVFTVANVFYKALNAARGK